MSRRHANITRLEIIQLTTEMILSEGFSNTTPKRICDALDISTGNLTYHFPTKEHILSVLVEMLCDFQWQRMQHMTQEGQTSLLAVCLELATIASMCEHDAIAKEFFLASYTHPKCLEFIRNNDTQRSVGVYGEFCPDWTTEQFAEAEILVSGIEYATLMTTNDSPALDVRISGALNLIMQIFNVPEDIRKTKIQKVLSMDYKNLGKQVLEEFRAFVKETNEHTLEQVLRKKDT